MTRLTDPWVEPRTEGQRFASTQHYNRPALGLWHLWMHTTEALTLTGIAAVATGVLVGIRTWRRLTTPTDETGD